MVAIIAIPFFQRSKLKAERGWVISSSFYNSYVEEWEFEPWQFGSFDCNFQSDQYSLPTGRGTHNGSWNHPLTIIMKGSIIISKKYPNPLLLCSYQQRSVDPEKIHLIWTPRRSLSAEMDSPWSTEDPNFITNNSLAGICWRGLLTDSVYWEEPPTELSAYGTLPCSVMHLSQLLRESSWFPLLTNVLRPTLSIQNCSIVTNPVA